MMGINASLLTTDDKITTGYPAFDTGFPLIAGIAYADFVSDASLPETMPRGVN